MALDSPSGQLSGRSNLESEYRRALAPIFTAFVGEVYTAARSDGFSLGVVLALWAASISQAEEQLGPDSAAVAFMKTQPLPETAYAAALAAVAASREEQLDEREASTRLKAALGLLAAPRKAEGADPRTEPGRLISPEGTLSVEAAAAEISRTAATADFGASVLAQLRREGYTHKRWMTRYDSRVRDSHADADRQTIPLEAEFKVGATTMRFPGDPNCSDLGEVVNCRCVLVGVNFGTKFPIPAMENYF